MEPGEYPTNVISSNSYGSLQYEYFEPQSLSTAGTRTHLQRLEAGWRQDGFLVHCDPFRDGIWVFQSATSTSQSQPPQASAVAEISNIVNLRGTELVLKDKGIYEPASLAKNKIISTNSFSASSISSSPSSSLENTMRPAQTFNSRAVQANASHNIANEPPTPSPGLKSATGPEDNWTYLKHIHECFISAVLGSIVFFLCHDHGFVPLNSRTLMLATPKPILSFPANNPSIILATLDISLTSLGSLVIKAYSGTAIGLQSLADALGLADASSTKIEYGTPLWLAPGGNAARFHAARDENKLPGNLPISQLQATGNRQNGLNGATIQSWQAKCLEWLAAKGLNTTALEEGGWIFVQVLNGSSPYLNPDYPGNPMLEDLAIVPWPALLCFQTTSSGSKETCSRPTSIAERDPLSFAEEWFISKDDREKLLAKRQKERQAAEARSKEQADVDARNLQSIQRSPAALRRGSNAGAMYPTPPDAIHQPIGATPSFDGGVSTPGNPNQLFTHDSDTGTNHINSAAIGQEAEMWLSSGKKDRVTTTMNFHDHDNDNDAIFADTTGALFDDITDADFNFFDEPDEIQTQQMASPEGAVVKTQESNSHVPETPALESTTAYLETNQDAQDSSTTGNTKQREGDLKLVQKEVTGGSLGTAIVETGQTSVEAPHTSVTPPFTKEAVFHRIFRKHQLEKRSSEQKRLSVFDKIDLETSLTSFNEKYSRHGRFSFADEKKRLKNVDSPTLPKTDYLSRRQKLTHDELDYSSLARILQEGTDLIELPADEDHPVLYLMDLDNTSITSEQDDTSHTTDDLAVAFKPGVKRKWTMDIEGGDDMTSSFNALAMEYAQSTGTPLSISGSQLPLLEGDPADWSLTTYFTSLEPELQSNALTDLECIETAQILADQAVSGTIKLPSSSSTDDSLLCPKASSTRGLMQNLTKAAKACLKDIVNCTMRNFIDIPGIPVLNQGLRLPPRPIQTPRGGIIDLSRAYNPFAIPPPQLEVRRSDSKLSVLPSAISFWENLSLGPSGGSKDVTSVCVHPKHDGVADNASIFLDQMRSVYESSRLGNHERAISQDLANSLISYNIDLTQQTKMHHLTVLRETTARLARILASLPVEDKNFVVYFVYPVDNPCILVHICSAFQHLFSLYKKALSDRKVNVANELVLQLIPLDFIASPTSIMVPSPSEYARLAMEVYDRCIDFSSFSSSPAILLEQPLPKNIDFKLNANPSPSLLQENSCLHIAYAQSLDDRWITAAWTDNRGTKQMTASYCLGRKNEPLSTPFSDIANEIWETTLDVISSKKIHWRIMITRVGVMDPSEIEFWTGLALTESNAQINLTLITVQTDPSLRLLPAPITLSPNLSSAQNVITPVSTPQAHQASIVSPETASTPIRDSAVNAATPVETPIEPDSDARLLDYTDQNWGAILAHRLNNSNSLLELNHALISGYLIKRGGTNSEDPPIVMEVNIVYSEVAGNPRTFHESLLREILWYYRNLGLLARVRGVVDPVKDIRPWHVAAAEKAVKALYMLM